MEREQIIENPVVRAAMWSIEAWLDKRHWKRKNSRRVEDGFAILKGAGEDFTAEDVRLDLLTRGYAQKVADRVASLAEKAPIGRKPGPGWRSDVIETWRQRAVDQTHECHQDRSMPGSSL